MSGPRSWGCAGVLDIIITSRCWSTRRLGICDGGARKGRHRHLQSVLTVPTAQPSCGPERMASHRLEAPNGVARAQISLSRRCRQLRPGSRDTRGFRREQPVQQVLPLGSLGVWGPLRGPAQRGDSMIAGGRSPGPLGRTCLLQDVYQCLQLCPRCFHV
ncbi:hypothetical protein N431DRAFT_211889 [Stipitochalara longipes BDJ]|nr:hypothetical protein N431DRAFT_211889 [Stipitochalara longipes BDJ]